MTPKELKDGILIQAVKGKLTKQLSTDGHASDLLSVLHFDKKHVVVDEPYVIPENWLWIPIGSLGETTGTDSFCDGPFGSNLKRLHQIDHPEVRIIQLSNIGETGWKNENEKYTSFQHLESVIPRCEVHPGDFVIAKMMPAGRTIEVPDVGTRITLGSDAMKFVPNKALNKKYLLYAMASRIFLDQVYAEAHGITRVRTTLKSVKSYVLPIPPLAEQKRIVERIEELMPLVDQYEEAWNRLEELNTRFPNDLQKSILQYAIQGKLVPQRSEEGTGEDLYQRVIKEKDRLIGEGRIKKNKPISAINEEELPFEIPNSWKWVKWGNVINVVSARRVHKSDWKTAGIPFYRAREIAQLAEKGFVDNELYITQELYDEFSKSGVPNAGDLMVTAVGTLGKTYVVGNDEKFYYKDASVICLENFAKLYPAYLKHVMQSEMMMNQIRGNSDGTTVATLTMVRMIEYVLPLPPFEEQKRIVERADELFMLCDELKGGS